ncbi:hypothetical protein CU254_13770 [Amycolatopsis sp. AA4]|uniref:hypothetical protein n=1 Tax=Actinomycetes TaxID=1760 RepID=UPI0001B585B4|nr:MULTISPECIES: hypothetical protein [Actinomycetes]ATY11407.1 hypothetical protein CU254_13770 [Amycolatopsis sp. AA4]EFL07027.1 hypothetical protein SSMG_02698 [Streptomyces sp. AA4]
MSIFARILQVFFMIAGLVSIGVGLIMVLIAKPYWTCEVSRNEPNYTSCRSTDLESFTSYHLFWFVLGLALEIMAVAVVAGARRRTVENLLLSMNSPAPAPTFPSPAAPSPYPGYPQQQPPYPGQ